MDFHGSCLAGMNINETREDKVHTPSAYTIPNPFYRQQSRLSRKKAEIQEENGQNLNKRFHSCEQAVKLYPQVLLFIRTSCIMPIATDRERGREYFENGEC